jgi:hypothetical protein
MINNMENIQEKRDKAQKILEVWRQNELNIPDVAGIIIEALGEYVSNIDSLIQQGSDHDKLEQLEGVETTLSKVQAEIINEDIPQ